MAWLGMASSLVAERLDPPIDRALPAATSASTAADRRALYVGVKGRGRRKEVTVRGRRGPDVSE